jgi:hypothetical protein
MTPLHVYLIDDGEQHWYIATSARRALTAFAKAQFGTSATEYLKENPETEISHLPDNEILTINQEGPDGSLKRVRHRCSTWTKQGAGFLCTTVW